MTNNDSSVVDLFKAAFSAQKSGQTEKAISLYEDFLSLVPDHPDAWHFLGLCRRQQKNWEQAVLDIRKSIELRPDNASAQNSMGATLCALNHFGEAEEYLNAAIKLQEDSVEAYRNLGLIYFARQKFTEAMRYFQTGLSYAPNHFEILKAAGNTLLHLGETGKALLMFERALSLHARDANLQTDTGIAYQMENRFREAMEFNSLAISIAPGENRHWTAFTACIEGMVPRSSQSVEEKLIALIDQGDHAPHDLMMPIAGTLFHRAEFREIINRYARYSEAEDIPPRMLSKDIEILSGIPLFLKLMSEYPITNILIEKLLTAVRRNLLISSYLENDAQLSFLFALALQCFNTEYSFVVSKQEEIRLRELLGEMRNDPSENEMTALAKIALAGCYQPLAKHFGADDVPDKNLSKIYSNMRQRLLVEPNKEEKLRGDIPDWTSSGGDVSDRVRSQYEENPYPRWTRTITTTKPRSVRTCLQSEPLGMELRNYQDPRSPEILVAGCGTGQHALQPATRFANAKVTAIDLSKTSLAYAKRQTAKLGVRNIEFGRADILELAKLNRTFDIIECSGVLHHLEDPVAGWQVLTKLLRPGGLMKIGLYSELARKDVVAGRKLVAEMEFSPSADHMRRCRQIIIAKAAAGDADLQHLSRRSDFFSLSAFRDLIFHVQEHRFDLSTIRDHLNTLDLHFLDFEMPFAGDLKVFRDSIATRSAHDRLTLWHEYEQQHPDTFRGMYQFWCQKAVE